MDPMRISLAMIVRNEEAVIGRVLECARQICDEMIVVDTGSRDNTVSIAKAAGAKVYHFEWIDDFAAARNYSFSLCSGEWILWLDADDVITPRNIEQLKELKDNIPAEYDAVQCTYNTRYERGECVFHCGRDRLVRRSAGRQWRYVVHESIEGCVSKSLQRPDIVIEHRPLHTGHGQRNVHIAERAYAKGDRSNHLLFHYAKDLMVMGRFGDALKIFEEYDFKQPVMWWHYWVMVWMGNCCAELQQRAKAKEWFLRATCMYPSRAEAWCAIGRLHYNAGEWAFAIPYFSAALNLILPDDESFVNSEDYSWAPREYLAICLNNAQCIDAAYRYCTDPQVIEHGDPVLAEAREHLRSIIETELSEFPPCSRPLVGAWGCE